MPRLPIGNVHARIGHASAGGIPEVLGLPAVCAAIGKEIIIALERKGILSPGIQGGDIGLRRNAHLTEWDERRLGELVQKRCRPHRKWKNEHTGRRRDRLGRSAQESQGNSWSSGSEGTGRQSQDRGNRRYGHQRNRQGVRGTLWLERTGRLAKRPRRSGRVEGIHGGGRIERKRGREKRNIVVRHGLKMRPGKIGSAFLSRFQILAGRRNDGRLHDMGGKEQGNPCDPHGDQQFFHGSVIEWICHSVRPFSQLRNGSDQCTVSWGGSFSLM